MIDLKDMLKKIPDVDLKVNVHKYDSGEMKPDYEAVGVSLKGEDEVFISVNAKRLNSQYPLRVEMKNLAKVKDCSWLIVVGEEATNKVFAIKKTFFKKTLRREFQVTVPRGTTKIDVFLMSDSYIGLDQIITIDLETYTTPEKSSVRFRRRHRKQRSGSKKRGNANNSHKKNKNNRYRKKNKSKRGKR